MFAIIYLCFFCAFCFHSISICMHRWYSHSQCNSIALLFFLFSSSLLFGFIFLLAIQWSAFILCFPEFKETSQTQHMYMIHLWYHFIIPCLLLTLKDQCLQRVASHFEFFSPIVLCYQIIIELLTVVSYGLTTICTCNFLSLLSPQVLRTRPTISLHGSNIHKGLSDIAFTSNDDSRLV